MSAGETERFNDPSEVMRQGRIQDLVMGGRTFIRTKREKFFGPAPPIASFAPPYGGGGQKQQKCPQEA